MKAVQASQWDGGGLIAGETPTGNERKRTTCRILKRRHNGC